MQILNERNQIRSVAARWRATYGSGSYGADRRGIAVGDVLTSLDVETASASDVVQIIGNESWVGIPKCDECGDDSWDIVQVCESSPVNLCKGCLQAALEMLNES